MARRSFFTSATSASRDSMSRSSSISTSSGDLVEPLADLRRALRPHQPRHLDPVLQEDQRRPQLDAEGTAERAPLAVLDLAMRHGIVSGEGFADQRLRRLAEAAPIGA